MISRMTPFYEPHFKAQYITQFISSSYLHMPPYYLFFYTQADNDDTKYQQDDTNTAENFTLSVSIGTVGELNPAPQMWQKNAHTMASPSFICKIMNLRY